MEWLIVEESMRRKEDNKNLQSDDRGNTIFQYAYFDKDIPEDYHRMKDSKFGRNLIFLVKRLNWSLIEN